MTEVGANSDTIIRLPLLQWLRTMHPDVLTDVILEELKLYRPSARIDLAVINGETTGFEIKSDRDTLRRLHFQIPAYSNFFDRVTLVTTRKHLELALKKIPSWWGLLIYNENNDFEVIREASNNKDVDRRSVLSALYKNELLDIAMKCSLNFSKSMKKLDIIRIIARNADWEIASNSAREAFKSRARSAQTSEPSCSDSV